MANQEDRYHRKAHPDAWEHLLGYAVVDKDGEKIGTVKALWEDYTRQPAYLGVATSWLDMGRIHVVPAQFATLSERRQCLRLPFGADVVKDAPQCHATDEITLSGETKIRDYYYRHGIPAVPGINETGTGLSRGEPVRKEPPARSPDWSARERRDEEQDSRSFRDRIRDDVDHGKSRIAGEKETERPETYGRAEREMGLPFSEERPSLRKIYRETPVAEPVLPRDEEEDRRPRGERPLQEDDFVPLRGEAVEAERRRGHDRDDLPLR